LCLRFSVATTGHLAVNFGDLADFDAARNQATASPGRRSPHATGMEAAHKLAITQNPSAPKFAYNVPDPSVSTAVTNPTATVP
jgi:hypothetical protein